MNNKSCVLIFAVALLSGCASLGSRAPAGVNLTGIWDLNPAQSDKPPALFRGGAQHRERRPHRHFGELREEGRMYGGPGGIGQGPGGGFPLGRPGGMGAGYGADDMRRHLIAEIGARELDIEQRENSLRIEYDRKRSVIYHWGESASQRSFDEPASGWVKGHFTIKAAGRNGRGIERTFVLSASHRMLTVVTKLGRHSITQRYALNRAATRKVYGSR